jgi:hypothetical protein
MTIEALRRLIRGEGHIWSYDSDVYSSKGLGPDGTPIYTVRSNTAGDGDPVDDEAKYGGAVYVELGTTNMLAADQRDAEGVVAGSYTAVNGATLSIDATHYWQGAKSLKCVTDAVGADQEGFATDAIDPGAGSNGKTYIASAYVKGAAGGEELEIYIQDNTNVAVGASVFPTLTTVNTWYRVSCFITIAGGDSASIQLNVLEKNNDSGYTWYSDGFQIEELVLTAANLPTSWVDGTRAAPSFYHDRMSWLYTAQDVTVNFWTKGPPLDYATECYFFGLIDSDGTYSDELRISGQDDTGAGNRRIRFTTINDNGTHNLDYSTNPWDQTWKMITAVLRYNAETGEYNKQLYIDGVSVGTTASTNTKPNLKLIDRMTVGIVGSAPANGAIDDLQVMPWAAPTAQVLAWYNMAKAMHATHPFMYASGDFVTDSEVSVIGKVSKQPYAPYYDGANSVHRASAGAIAFTLHE